MPMIFVLLEQIGEIPPSDFLMNAQIKARAESLKREQRSAIDSFPKVQGKVRSRTDGD